MVLARRSVSTVGLWVLVASVFISREAWAFLALIGLLAVVGMREYFRMVRQAGLACFPRFGMLLAVGYLAGLLVPMRYGISAPVWLDALGIFAALAGAFALQMRYPIRGQEALVAVSTSVLGFIYIPFLFSFAARILFADPAWTGVVGRVSDGGAYLLLWLLAVTKFTDMGAYLTGSAIGRHKMIPHVSPAKTWEGFAGALVFALGIGCALYGAFPVELAVLKSWWHVISLSLILAVLAVVGDLAESVVKRALGAKDSGHMLPGIGGSLDLIDSVCFTAPVLWIYLQCLLLTT